MSEWGDFKEYIRNYLSKRSELLKCKCLYGVLHVKKTTQGIHEGDLFFGCRNYPNGCYEILNFSSITEFVKDIIYLSVLSQQFPSIIDSNFKVNQRYKNQEFKDSPACLEISKYFNITSLDLINWIVELFKKYGNDDGDCIFWGFNKSSSGYLENIGLKPCSLDSNSRYINAFSEYFVESGYLKRNDCRINWDKTICKDWFTTT